MVASVFAVALVNGGDATMSAREGGPVSDVEEKALVAAQGG